MTNLLQAAKIALDVLEREGFNPVDLRQAIAQAEQQEPVARVVSEHTHSKFVWMEVLVDHRLPCNTKLYAAPVRTKDLTDEEIEECVHIADSECTEDACMPWFVEFARAVIAADRELNK